MVSSRILSALAVGCLLVTLTVPSVAISLNENKTTGDDVVLEPTSQYGSFDTNDNLRLDLEALNKRAITTFDDLFSITVNDDAVERIWIDSHVNGLEFYADGDRTAKISESSPLEPAAGDTASIGVEVDAYIDQGTEDTFTVHVEYAADDEDDTNETPKHVNLESFTVHPTTLETGDSVTANATYTNHERTTKTVTSSLTVDGIVVDRQTVDIDPGETKSVVFEREMQWPGRYDIGVDGTMSERVTVEGPPIDVLSVSITDTELTAGETASIQATVTNPTDTRVDRTLELAVDGIVVDTRSVTVQPNGETTVTFDRRFDTAGTYDIAVSGVDAGTVTVSDRSPIVVLNRELSAAATAALAPPLTMGFLFLAIAANRRWAFYST